MFLWPSLQAREELVAAKNLCAAMDDKDLANLLRHHRAGEVRSLEVNDRQIFDYALQSYSLLAVAIVAGYIPAVPDQNIRDEITSFLGREPVRLYYEKHYPIFLPSLLRLHVIGSIHLPQESGDLAWGSFQWFMRFSGRFEKDRNLEAFLRLLDGFHYRDLDITSFLNGLNDPAEALAGIFKPPDLLSRRDRSVLGMLRFMTFCRELAPALEAMAGAPLTQSACWFYYAYWFKGFAEDVGSRVENCLSIFEGWVKSSNAIGIAAANEAEKTVSDVRSAIAALVDGRYAAPLVNRLKSM